VSGLLNSENFLDPRDDFMGTGVRGFVKIDDSVFEILLEGSFEGSGSCGDGRVVGGEDIHEMVVAEKERPILRLDAGPFFAGTHHKLLRGRRLLYLHLSLDELLLLFVLLHSLLNQYNTTLPSQQ
jgi:hypothetical protein